MSNGNEGPGYKSINWYVVGVVVFIALLLGLGAWKACSS